MRGVVRRLFASPGGQRSRRHGSKRKQVGPKRGQGPAKRAGTSRGRGPYSHHYRSYSANAGTRRSRKSNAPAGSGRRRAKSGPRGGARKGAPRHGYGGGNGAGSVVAYHGTPSAANAGDIVRNGFMVGRGNLLGDGVYFTTDKQAAKGYGGSRGVYLKCRIRLGKTCNWNGGLDSRFRQWCKSRSVIADSSAQTAFLLRQGFDTLRSGATLVVLRPQFANPSAYKVKLRQVRVLSVHRASDDRQIRV